MLAEKAQGSAVKLLGSLCYADPLTHEHGTMTDSLPTNTHALTVQTSHAHTHVFFQPKSHKCVRVQNSHFSHISHCVIVKCALACEREI